MENCVFCQIVKGKIPSYKIYEDKDFLAFLDIAPFCEGHTMVIPKKHYRWIWEVPNFKEFYAVVNKIVIHYQKAFGDKFVASIVWGQLIPHAHVQILPSPKNLRLDWQRGKLTPEKTKELIKQLSLGDS